MKWLQLILVIWFPGLGACGDSGPMEAGAASAGGQHREDEPDLGELAQILAQEPDDRRRLQVSARSQAGEPAASVEGPVSLVVFVSFQWLELRRGGVPDRGWPVSTSSYGTGSQAGSHRTPLGEHRICETFGEGARPGAIFESRRDTGRLARITTDETDSEEDHVTTRVMWLEGLEEGLNRGPGIDSKQRYIYIHGTPEEGLIGTPASHGCIRMTNADVIELFDLIELGTPVRIVE